MPVQPTSVPSAPAATPQATGSLGATAYGSHLALVLRAACQSLPRLWSAEELRLQRVLIDAPWAALVARICQRSQRRMALSETTAPAEDLAAAALSGWLMLTQDALELAPGAWAFYRAALVVAFAGERDDLSFFPRLAFGRLRIPPGCPLRAQLEGGGVAPSPPACASAPPWLPAALRSRHDLDAFLVARDAREQGPSEPAFERALHAVEALAGAPWELLGFHLSAPAQWTRLLWDCREALPLTDPRRDRALRALRRAPLSPALARQLWDAVHRRAKARSGRFIAGHISQFALWNPGSRCRYLARARKPGAKRAPDGPWRVEHISAWLERDRTGAVVAHGEGVEAHALTRLAVQGWQGVHGEGHFWAALATLLFWPDITAPVPGTWVAPLQAWPLDWRRHGFSARRQAAISRTSVRLVREPERLLQEAYATLGEEVYPGWFTPPPRLAAEAVCRLMPCTALMRLLQRVLSDATAVSGLPDLITWRGTELVLWEVKSPNDQLSDSQRAWLGWLVQEGIQAGELRIDARIPTQGSLFAPAAPSAQAAAEAAAACAASPQRRSRSQPRARPPEQPCVLTALAGAGWMTRIGPGEALPAGFPVLAREPLLAISAWTGCLGDGAVAHWDRPVQAILALPVEAVLMTRRRQRTVLSRRWYPIPPGFVMPILISPQAQEHGGVVAVASVLQRASGWLIPAHLGDWEPVVASQHEIDQVLSGGCGSWRLPPQIEPLRIEDLAQAWGCGEDLQAQLALVGSQPCQLDLGSEPGTLRLSIVVEAPIVWTISEGRIQRGELPVERAQMVALEVTQPR